MFETSAGVCFSPLPWEKNETTGWPTEATGLAQALSKSRDEREITFQLRRGLCDVESGFAHLVIQGLDVLIETVRQVSHNPETIQTFCNMQRQPTSLRLLPHILRLVPGFEGNCLNSGGNRQKGIPDCTSQTEKRREGLDNEADEDAEEEEHEELVEAKAMELLEGVCILDPSTRAQAVAQGMIQVLIKRLEVKCSEATHAARLDLLLSLLLPVPTQTIANQSQVSGLEVLRRVRGAEAVARVLRNRPGGVCSVGVRLKTVHFLCLILGQIAPPPLYRQSDDPRGAGMMPIAHLPPIDAGVQDILGSEATSLLSQAVSLTVPNSSEGIHGHATAILRSIGGV